MGYGNEECALCYELFGVNASCRIEDSDDTRHELVCAPCLMWAAKRGAASDSKSTAIHHRVMSMLSDIERYAWREDNDRCIEC